MFPDSGSSKNHADLIAAARQQFESARRADRRPAGFERGTSDRLNRGEHPVDAIRGYEILREIHRGGQGVVYQAIQTSTRRTVAIKVLREGPFAGEQDRNRFERETAILAQLSHPHIVGIIDRGVESGCYYFIMDFVDGASLERYADAENLDIRSRLRLFTEVCEAVNFAHLRGIIHRDLKPGNILIDTNGRPRILDFGLAKSTDGEAASFGSQTLTGQFVGSLPWASPEQVQGDAAQIDTRTDVYSLGVMLYHLLTGTFPYRVAGSMRDVLDNIVRAEPPAPSSVVGRGAITSGSGRPERLDRDLDAIVLKCLGKDREGRYQTAGELARDIRRYLAGEPVEARRQGTWYVVGKSLKRHRVAAAVSAGFLVLVLAASVVSLALWRMAVRERDEAVAAQRRADLEAAKSIQIARFAQDMLSGIDPATAGDLDKRLMRLVLDDAAARVERELAGQPAVEASIRRTIGLSYQAIGEWPSAARQLEKSLELFRAAASEMDPETLGVLNDLGMLYKEQGRLPDAQAACEKAIEGRTLLLGPEHRDTLISRSNLAEVLKEQGNPLEAEALNRIVLEARTRTLGPEHPDTLTSLNNLAIDLQMLQRTDEAEAILRKVIEVESRVKGPTHPESMRTVNNLAIILQYTGRLEEAENILREGVALRERVLGKDHPDTLRSLGTLAETIRRKGDLPEAEKMFRHVIDEYRRVLGSAHPTVALHIYTLANIVATRGDLPGAEPLFREALEICRTSLPPSHLQTGHSKLGLAACMLKLKKFSEAEELLLEVQKLFEGNPEVDRYWHQSLAVCFMNLYGDRYKESPNNADAEKTAYWRERAIQLTPPTSQPASAPASDAGAPSSSAPAQQKSTA